MIKRAAGKARKIYDPTPRQLAVSALKGAGMGALLAFVLIKALT
ncbi:MAG: hypothetical protein ACK4SZ_08520 [Allosphingosinicella sp.]